MEINTLEPSATPTTDETGISLPALILTSGVKLRVGQALRGPFHWERGWRYRSTRDGQDTSVVWSRTPVTVALLSKAGLVTIRNITGATSTGNLHSLAVGVNPVFVQVTG